MTATSTSPLGSPASVSHCIGPLGEALTAATMPPLGARWTPRRKAEIVAAVTGGLFTLAEVTLRYDIAIEEYALWARNVGRSGLNGLRVTRTQKYRELHEREQD